MREKEYFPDGTVIDDWFYDLSVPDIKSGALFAVTDYGAKNDGNVYTKEIQSAIDAAHESGGGTVYVPNGTYVSGALYFKRGVNLYIERGGVLKGSDDISDYPPCETRIEGETCVYFPALVNADGLDGFVLSGEGVIDGSGEKSWRAFWLRREWNPDCTNKDEQRPRLVYISNSKNVIISGLTIQNSHFWTTHLYRCERVKYINCRILSPRGPVKAPSTDAVDIDVCRDVLIKNCYMAVNDDAVALKGGKGAYADTLPENGMNERVIVEDCGFGFCHSCLTCGSESIHNRNIIMRRVKVNGALNLLWLKMRPDTPQLYEYITVEDIEGTVRSFLHIRPWTQFFDLGGRNEIPLSRAEHIAVRRCAAECVTYCDAERNDGQYRLSCFTFEDIDVKAVNNGFNEDLFDGAEVKNVTIHKIPEDNAAIRSLADYREL